MPGPDAQQLREALVGALRDLPDLQVAGELSFRVDGPAGGTSGTVRGDGGTVRVHAEDPVAAWDAALGSSSTGPAVLRAVADRLADTGLVLEVSGPGGHVATVGAGVDSPVGRLLTGSRRVRLGRPAAVRPLAVAQVRRTAGAALPAALAVLGVALGLAALRRARRSNHHPGPELGWRGVDPALLRVRRLLAALGVGLPTLVVAVVLLVLLGPVAAVAAVLVGGAVLLLVLRVVRRQVAAWAWTERDDDLLLSRGVLVRRTTVVPYGRMQYVDVTAGPLDRRYGIATVVLHTAAAATDAVVPGLRAADAERLRDRLAALGEARAAGV